MGVGPWYYIDRVQTDWFRHCGVDSAVEMSIALANSGDLQIELIQQRNDAPSMYKEFLEAGYEGLQHLAFWSKNYQALYDEALRLGVERERNLARPHPAEQHVSQHAGCVQHTAERLCGR